MLKISKVVILFFFGCILFLNECIPQRNTCWIPHDKYDSTVGSGRSLILVTVQSVKSGEHLSFVTTNQIWIRLLKNDLKLISGMSEYTNYMHKHADEYFIVPEELFSKLKSSVAAFPHPITLDSNENRALKEVEDIIKAANNNGCRFLEGKTKDNERQWFRVVRLLLEKGLIVVQEDFSGKWSVCYVPNCATKRR